LLQAWGDVNVSKGWKLGIGIPPQLGQGGSFEASSSRATDIAAFAIADLRCDDVSDLPVVSGSPTDTVACRPWALSPPRHPLA
jgi:hypothetical protein